ncbi:DUF397 domain-containing protein [Microbispora triticiradicis]|uniref:DUF397 domain-containing protein n=2 Tax=Microbispora triticiradicis TaxID=2200763 RepID=A0ABX9LS45_9ACTN|nr:MULTISPECIES: DUF397 domain-containing protein [Microbispora]RGA06725.1 DUF397 domain-containing protein [Microbispora triticiradicis]TLP66564.1 DUF397 domain-containing protein [Microbispora fusca]GLW25468.1 transcriptional regulator [Microbispora amethystogenes]
MSVIYNGMPSSHLGRVGWRKSRHSNPSGNCVEIAALPQGLVALRNSRHPSGPALIMPVQDIAAFVRSAKEGEFDDLLQN